MAKLIKAISIYSPRIKTGLPASMRELVTFISGRTGLTRGDIQHVLSELNEAITFFHLSGRGVTIDGLGYYFPKINFKGEITTSYRIDRQLKANLNKKNAFAGEMDNRDMIGKTSGEIAARWNEEHPDDQVV